MTFQILAYNEYGTWELHYDPLTDDDWLIEQLAELDFSPELCELHPHGTQPYGTYMVTLTCGCQYFICEIATLLLARTWLEEPFHCCGMDVWIHWAKWI